MTDIKPSDVEDGDLLSGTLYGNPFTDWPVRRIVTGYLFFGSMTIIGGHSEGWGWLDHVTVTSRKPAPKPLLPWELHTASLWHHVGDDPETIFPSKEMDTEDDPDDWRRVLVVPADTHVPIPRALIEEFRKPGSRSRDLAAITALLAAVDEAND